MGKLHNISRVSGNLDETCVFFNLHKIQKKFLLSETAPPEKDIDTKTRGSEQSLLLPEDIIEDILLRLPVKTLLRFRCVSRSWLSLIGSGRFIETHYQYSTKNTDFAHHRVLISRYLLKQCSLRSMLNEPPDTDPPPLDDPMNSLSDLFHPFSVVGCCNGLVCILKKPQRLFLWNPSMKISRELPKAEDRYIIPCRTKYGFGWDESSGAYKVFVDMHVRNGSVAGEIFSSKTNSWKTVDLRGLPVLCEVEQFVGGKLHWSSSSDIIWLDLKTEVFGTMELPFIADVCVGQQTFLGVLGEFLCVVCDHSKIDIDVWVMKEYGVKESWLKLVSLSLVNEPHEMRWFADIVGVGQNGEVLMTYGQAFLVYYSKDNVLRQLREIASFHTAYLYVESLVSPLDLIV